MRNEWLEDFRLDLYVLGKAIWDYQEGVPGAIFDVYDELKRVAKQVVREFGTATWQYEKKDMIEKGCILHMTVRNANGQSLLDKIDLSKEDPFAFAIMHMTQYMQSNH